MPPPSGAFIVNFEHISHLVLVFLLLNFEHEIAGWVLYIDLSKKIIYLVVRQTIQSFIL